MHRALVSFIGIALAACSGSGSPMDTRDDSAADDNRDDAEGDNDTNNGANEPTSYKSGSRIKMKTGRTPDGAQMFMGWHDTELGIDCGFQLAGDEKIRCLPLTTAYTSNHFSDAQCIIPLGLSSYVTKAVCDDRPSVLPVFVRETLVRCNADGTVEGNYAAIFRRVTGYFEGGAIYMKEATGNCVANTSYPSNYFMYRLGEEATPETFQEMTVSIE